MNRSIRIRRKNIVRRSRKRQSGESSSRSFRQPSEALIPSAFSVEAAEQWALQRSQKLPADLFRLMAFWYVSFFVQWVPEDRKTRYTVRMAQSENYGLACGFIQALHDPDPDFVGKDTRQILRDKLCRDYLDRTALVDLLIARVSGPPQRQITLKDAVHTKYAGRSRMFGEEAERVLRRKGAKALKGSKPRAVVIGATSGIIDELIKRGFEVSAADLSPEVVGMKLGGVLVRDGNVDNAQLIRQADLAIFTGMTLSNRTLEGLIELAKKYNTSTMIWAITGKNFGYYYTEHGVDCVISDFLMLPGPATLTISRRKN
jgi:Putative heavy-metal chelation